MVSYTELKYDTQDTHKDNTIEALLEPCHSILLLDTVREANSRLCLPPLRYPRTRTTHHDVEVHTEDTDAGIVTCAQIDVLLDTETKVSGIGEVLAAELVLLDLQPTLQDLLGLGATDGDVHGDLFVTTDTERSDGVAGLGGDGGLTGKLLEDLGGTGETITGFTDGDVCYMAGTRRVRATWTTGGERSETH